MCLSLWSTSAGYWMDGLCGHVNDAPRAEREPAIGWRRVEPQVVDQA